MLFGFVIGVVVGASAAVLLAIFLPDRWLKITRETGEEINK